MPAIQEVSFNDHVAQYLGVRLPAELADAVALSDLSPNAQAFILRALSLMAQSGYSARNFTAFLIRWLSTSVPSLLPEAWGGRIPPITMPGRHGKLDAYVAATSFTTGDTPPVFVDAGCGFPPVTTVDTARRFPDWQIYGVDDAFADYVLYDSDGHYACFDASGHFQYFQAMMNLSGRALYDQPDETRKHFTRLYTALSCLLRKTRQDTSETVERDGCRLIFKPMRDYDAGNLKFIKSDIAHLDMAPAKVIRCMNLLIYYTPEIRKQMLRRISRLMEDDGLLLAGTNGLGMQSRYTVYRSGNHGMVPGEFAFSLDNFGPIVFMPWFTIHDADPEACLLARVAASLRTDSTFWSDFSRRVDGLYAEHDIYRRKSDGFFAFPEKEMSPAAYLEINARLWQKMDDDGHIEAAVAALDRAGYHAWRNPAGDIAIRPPDGILTLD